MCTRNYAEWRSQLSETNPLKQLGSFVKRATLLKNHNEGNGGGPDRLLRIDISILNYDREKDAYTNEKQYLLDNQDIDLIATNVQTPLVATSSMSGDLRTYDALTCESLAIIKRSHRMINDSSSSIFPYKPSEIIDEMLTNVDDHHEKQNVPNVEQPPVVIKTEGNLLRTLFYGIQNEDVSNDDEDNFDDGHREYLDSTNEQSECLDFRPIWCIDIHDKYVLLGCGGDDGRFEIWDAYTGRLSFVYYPDAYRNGNEDLKVKKSNDSYAITVIKSTYWAVALARLNGQLEILELEQFKEDKYSTIFQPDTSSSQTKCYDQIRYRLKFRIQAHKQPITRIEIIDSLEDDEFIRVFGSRGCLISGSMDTTLKVFALDNFKLMYTLNGHCGSIMTTAIDPYSTASALSGCQLGQMCVWDLNTGACIFSMQAHLDAEVLSIVTSPLYFVTTGTDNTICIWDRYSGHLIHRITNQHTICRSMVFLEPFILVTVRDNELIIWDCNDARSICIVPLASHTTDIDSSTGNQMIINQNENKWTKSYLTSSIKNLVFSFEQKALICDYGNLLCVINNPFATKKID
ncbi:hypothetical protein BLA29_001407 [Euroglyphus maynei]|uniref:Uncharacterized protein n=1 Tax=Euroglyphus maynei TaxID=6958 RepID=A0A1Y3BLF1_EURMA|nr:hypothetical protein BLA29_001407 [Euroglyphus maynei]